MKLSARNQLKGKIINIKVGSDAYAVIKATNVMVGIDE